MKSSDNEEKTKRSVVEESSFVEHEESKRKLIEIVEKETLIKEITPFEAFVLVLKTYLDSFEEREVGNEKVG